MSVSAAQVLIRYAEVADLAHIIELCHQHAQFEGANYSAEGKLASLRIALFAEVPALYCVVVELDADIVAYASYMRQFSTWDAGYYLYMDCLYLKDEVRGLGIGAKLMQWIRGEAKRLHCKHIQWQTPIDNESAIGFYRQQGAIDKTKARFFLSIKG